VITITSFNYVTNGEYYSAKLATAEQLANFLAEYPARGVNGNCKCGTEPQCFEGNVWRCEASGQVGCFWYVTNEQC